MSVPGAGEQVRVDPDVRRVLVYRLGSLGDTLVALPSLHLVARVFPNAERRMLTNVPVASRAPAAAAVLGKSGLIHSYEPYPLRLRSPGSLLGLLLRIRWFRPEVILYMKSTTDMYTVKRDAWFLKLTGARRVVGLPLTPEYHQHARLADGSFESEASRLARTMHQLGTIRMEDAAGWDLRLSVAELAKADEALRPLGDRPFLAVSVGTKVQAKDWGVRNWGELLHVVAQQYAGYGLLLAGAAEESASSEKAAERWRSVDGAGPVVNLCGRLSPRESAAAFRNAAAFVGHDSGPMHLAAVVGAPTVAIFSSRNLPQTWFPICRYSRVLYHHVDCMGCDLEVCTAQRKKCILSITVQEVAESLRSLMEECRRSETVPAALRPAVLPHAASPTAKDDHAARTI